MQRRGSVAPGQTRIEQAAVGMRPYRLGSRLKQRVCSRAASAPRGYSSLISAVTRPACASNKPAIHLITSFFADSISALR